MGLKPTSLHDSRGGSYMRRRLTLSLIVALAAPHAAEAADPAFAPLPQTTQRQLANQRLFVSSLVANNFPGEKLSGSKSDFQLLQRILDAKLIPKTRTWELQALGVAFGDSLVATVPGLAWWQVTDEYGTDPTVRYRETTVQINALTALSKRVERSEGIEVEKLAEHFSKFIETEAKKFK
ncbi:DUF3806 domain-containing protein [Hydrogenophaga taeniospiralis]|uniref:DUF3806 domain-containing protein n=1 Tax=Hydrogenophaga taeniospiralis TaxID=65656 RepID=UPI0009FD027B|nr:DUF3806 domain-containing protein [Hydrogenophaga taeniospiralis]